MYRVTTQARRLLPDVILFEPGCTNVSHGASAPPAPGCALFEPGCTTVHQTIWRRKRLRGRQVFKRSASYDKRNDVRRIWKRYRNRSKQKYTVWLFELRMNSSQITRIRRTRYSNQFYDVYSKDTHKPAVTPTADYRLQPWSRLEDHCIVLYIDTNEENFDSFGRKPWKTFEQFMNKYCDRWTFSERQLQSIVSYYCGQYCVFYPLYRSIGFDLNAIIACFTRDTGVNDYIVHKFVCRLL
jgi:hypothetical protein